MGISSGLCGPLQLLSRLVFGNFGVRAFLYLRYLGKRCGAEMYCFSVDLGPVFACADRTSFGLFRFSFQNGNGKGGVFSKTPFQVG